MGVTSRAARHAVGLYGRTFRRALSPIHAIEDEAHHLHVIEQRGESAETPYIAMLGLFFFLASIFAFLLIVALAAYYLA